MRNLRQIAIITALCLMLYSTVFAVDSISLGEKGLSGRQFLVLGDSYTAGYGLSSMAEDWTYLMAAQYRMTQFNYSISGSTFAGGPNGNYPMVERCLTLPADSAPDFIILQGGSNDWSHNISMGQEGDQDPATFYGALNLILDTLSEKYPRAEIVGFSPWVSDGTQNKVGLIQQDYTDAMLRIFAERGLDCYDASDTDQNGMFLNRKEFRETYCLNGGDWYHLSAGGHAMFAPIISQWLEDTLYPVSIDTRFYDLTFSSSDLHAAVLSLVDDGILSGIAPHLFFPTRATTRSDLAQALYRMEGYPEFSDHSMYDVDAADPAYPAVCWAMDAGLFSESEWFYPDSVLTREMLSTVLYRFYADYEDGFVSATVGLGTYRDGSAVASYARIPLGWALSADILSEQNGMLKPGGAVSRGQLALSLYRLRQLL